MIYFGTPDELDNRWQNLDNQNLINTSVNTGQNRAK